jgi:hypothetical protein
MQYKPSLAPPRFIEVSVPRQGIKW